MIEQMFTEQTTQQRSDDQEEKVRNTKRRKTSSSVKENQIEDDYLSVPSSNVKGTGYAGMSGSTHVYFLS